MMGETGYPRLSSSAQDPATRGGERPGRRAKPYRGRYRPLLDLLAATEADQLTLTFTEIEAMIGMPLAPSARQSASVWTKADRGYVRQWRAMGWSAHPDTRAGRVEWRRVDSRETSGLRNGED